jgi:signal transduction histidine kinase
MMKRNRWPLISPQAILLITLATAAVVFIGGIYLAQREEHVHEPGSRKPIQRIGEEMEKKSGQLEQLYAKDLRHLVSVTLASADDPPRISELCNSIVGVEQWSLIHGARETDNDIHVPIDPTSTIQWPRPTFQIKPDDMRGDSLLLSKDDLLHTDGQTWGWIMDPGKPLLFWQRPDAASDAVVVLLIDPQPVRAALNTWFGQWAQESFAPLQVRNGPICALESSDTILMSTGTLPATPPDFILPIRSSFGTWEIMAWDRIIIRTTYDFKTLAIAIFLALLIVLLGAVGYLQQKQLLAQTAQRVTFVNRVSHELRSPLTNILLNLELTREMLAESQEQPARRLGLVQEEAHRLRRLVDNVLAFSSFERGKNQLKPHSCVPDEIILAVIQQFAPSFARRGLIVNYRGDVAAPCLLDGDAVTQILSNLFSNIEKYVPNGTVTVNACFLSSILIITVADEGPGIPVREAERIFQPFERLDGRINEGATGTGLGLSSARELAIGMGGALRLIPGRAGASFELRVPASAILHSTDSIS